MSRFWKDIAGEHYETLVKAIYRKDVGQVVDPNEYLLPLLSVPKGLLSWCMQNIKPMQPNETKDIQVPGSDAVLHVTKLASDIYKGEIYKAGSKIHSFEPLPLPALAGTLLTVCELYEDVAGRPVEEIEKKELAEKIKDDKSDLSKVLEKIGMLIDKIAEQKIKKEELESKPAHAPQPVVVNVNLSHIGNSSEEKKKVEPMAESKDLDKGELEKSPPAHKHPNYHDAEKRLQVRQARAANKPKKYGEKSGVHDTGFSAYGKETPGKSLAGNRARAAQSYGKDMESSKHSVLDAAKHLHSQKLQELKSMPKPNLPKAEMEKASWATDKVDSHVRGVHTSPSWQPEKGKSYAGTAARSSKTANNDEEKSFQNEEAKEAHHEVINDLRSMPKPNLPKAEMQKDEFKHKLIAPASASKEVKQHADALKHAVRAERSEKEQAPKLTNENFSEKGRNTPIAQLLRWKKLNDAKKQAKLNLPKAEMEKSDSRVKGVHEAREDHIGQSTAGIEARNAKKLKELSNRMTTPVSAKRDVLGASQAMAHAARRSHSQKLQELKSMPKPNLPKAELEKMGISINLGLRGSKVSPMQPTKPVSPTMPSTSAKPKLQMPKNANSPSPKMPKTPVAQTQMKQALSGVSKEEMECAKSDDQKPMFLRDGEHYKFNPTGVNAVMTKDSMQIKKNEDNTYSIFVNKKQWDLENVQLLIKMVKLRSALKSWGV